jgi:hypothetical protein
MAVSAAQPGAIVLMHDGLPVGTLETGRVALPRIIAPAPAALQAGDGAADDAREPTRAKMPAPTPLSGGG